MSNPGVIVLNSANCRGTNFKRFQVEDNIGESIHIHVDNIRFDFTIEEFLSLSKAIEVCLRDQYLLKDYSLSELDLHFLSEIAPKLPNFVSITEDRMKISELKFIIIKSWW